MKSKHCLKMLDYVITFLVARRDTCFRI
jgi:hypothetical protein